MRHYNIPMEKAVKEWVKTHKECDIMVASQQQGQSLTLRYEDLCMDTGSVMAGIYTFLGLDRGLGQREYVPSNHHILGNAMRLRPIGQIRLDEKWKTRLSARDLEIFERFGGGKNRSYGYA